MKTIVVKTRKVVAHLNNGMPKFEEINQTLSPDMTITKFIKYLPNQGYESATVLSVFENDKEVDEVEHYQSLINEALKPETKYGDNVDYKALSEKQSKLLADMEARLAALENKGSANRSLLEEKANELNISFRANIGDDKLLAKIQEIEPEFNL